LIFTFFLLRNKFRISSDIDFRKDIFLILGKILVGPLEEIPFRGFYMQKFKETMSFSKANILSSALFAFMHITVYSLSGISLVYSLAYVMVIGLWMGYIFEKTKSLWCVSIVHSIYDISIWLLL
jgi:membrane protease YdiL (CAAX protease family)